MFNPKVSIVIANHNYAEYLPLAVDSALAQDYPQIEVIVVDDGSTDDSRQVLQRYQNQIKVFHKECEGQTSALNLGFSNSSGDLIAFLDSDDLLAPFAISEAVRNWRPEFTKLQFPLSIIDSSGHELGLLMPRCKLGRGKLETVLLSSGRYVTSPTSGNVFSRAFLERVMPVPVKEWPASTDSYLSTYAVFNGEIGALDKPLGYYRVHKNNITGLVRQGSVDANQLEKIRTRTMWLKTLIHKIARERNLECAPDLVVSHWLYLKLELSIYKLTRPSRFLDLFRSTRKMVSSAAHAEELNFVKRAQVMAWAVWILLLPKPLAEPILKMAFETAPPARLPRLLRRF